MFLKTKSKVMNISFHFKFFLVLVSILFLVGQGQSQNCQVQLFEDKAVISYSSTMGKGSSIKYFMKDKVKNRWIEIKNVSGDAGLIVTQQKTYVGIWNHQQECQIKDIESIKVRIQSTDGTEEELLGQINQPSNTEPKVFDFAETKATYPGGEEAMYAELVRNLVYPELEKVNGIQDFRSIRFMRMFMKGFDEEVLLRFARLELIRGEWRRYKLDLTEPGESVQVDPNLTTFNIAAVNVEENDQRSPIKYEIPPGILREIDPSQTYQRQLNEQSLVLDVCNLQDGDARAAYRNVQFDVRTYKKLKMFVHAEEVLQSMPLNNQDLTLS